MSTIYVRRPTHPQGEWWFFYNYFTLNNLRNIGSFNCRKQDDRQRESWIRSIEVFDEERGEQGSLALFSSDREIPARVADAIGVRLSEFVLKRPREWGACWLFSELWEQLGLRKFWQEKLGCSREGTDWEHVLEILVAHPLIELGPVNVNERVKDESDVNEGREHGIEFIKARENPPESFESAEEPLDFIALFKELEVVFPLVEAISLWRHHWLELHVGDHLSGFVTLIRHDP